MFTAFARRTASTYHPGNKFRPCRALYLTVTQSPLLEKMASRGCEEVVFFFVAVAPPGLFRPDVVPQTFFVIV